MDPASAAPSTTAKTVVEILAEVFRHQHGNSSAGAKRFCGGSVKAGDDQHTCIAGFGIGTIDQDIVEVMGTCLLHNQPEIKPLCQLVLGCDSIRRWKIEV